MRISNATDHMVYYVKCALKCYACIAGISQQQLGLVAQGLFLILKQKCRVGAEMLKYLKSGEFSIINKYLPQIYVCLLFVLDSIFISYHMG